MEERFRFLQEHQSGDWSLAELCRQYGISRKTGYKWLERYDQKGLEGLRDQSRAPLRHPNEVVVEVADAIIDLRRQHPLWGPEKLHAWLHRNAPEIVWPAPSTMGELLKRRGLTVPPKHHRRVGPSLNPLSQAEAANQIWCTDFKGWFRCGDGSRCDPLTLTDAHSRYLLRCQAVAGMDTRSVRDVMESAFREFGLPNEMLNDNGEPFASQGIGGLSQLSVWWVKLNIRPVRIPPGKPQYNGKHERMHRTLKAATATPPAANLRLQQQAFDEFLEEYNHQRPHEALQMKPPGEFYTASCRPYPSRLAEPEYGNGWEVRRVRECGRIRWWSDNIFVGRALSGEAIGLEPVDDGVWRVWFYAYPLGLFEERKGKITKSPTAPTESAPKGAHEALPHTSPGGKPPETPAPLSL